MICTALFSDFFCKAAPVDGFFADFILEACDKKGWLFGKRFGIGVQIISFRFTKKLGK